MNKINNLLIITILLISIITNITIASEVPFEVVKTKIKTETTINTNSEAIAVNGELYSPSAINEELNPPKKGEYDTRTKIPIEGINYKLEFWNVGEMGGEKGFIFKSNYGKAILKIKYQTGQAYKKIPTGKKYLGGLQKLELKEVNTPNINNYEYELTFTGGPTGIFLYKQKDGSLLHIAHIENGKYIIFDSLPEPKYMLDSNKIKIEIKDNYGFEKWLEILKQNEQNTCSDPTNPQKDSGIRFNSYEGEVMIRPCDDEDAWYGAELDMILHKEDHIKTGDDSTCSLGLNDMTHFIMKPESEIILSSPNSKESKIKLIWGKIKTNFKRTIEDGTMEIEMSQAVAGIKGTTLITEETKEKSTLKVIEGHVEFTSKATGKSKLIGPGEMISATKKGLEKIQKFDIKKEEKTWNKKNITKNNNTLKNSKLIKIFQLITILIIIIGIIYTKNKKFHKDKNSIKK